MTTTSEPAPASAFRVRNFRLFFFGQGLSNVGTWFQMIAQALLVLKITGRGSDLGLVIALQFVPMLILGPYAGVIIDRVDVRRLIVATSVTAGAQALALGAITASGHVTILWILSLSLVAGFVQIFDRPAAQAFISELVEPDLIPSAVGLNNVTISAGRLVGPAVGAAVYVWRGPAACFYANAVSYGLVAVAMLLLRRSELVELPPNHRAPGQLREGLAYAWASPVHRWTLIVNAVVGCLSFNFLTVYPALIAFVFHAGSGALGAAESINATFAVIGGVLIARHLRHPTLGLYALSCLLLGASLAWSAGSPTLAVFIVGMPFFGVTVVYYQTVALSLLQQRTPPHLVGRVMSLYMLGMSGTTPIGAILTGWMIDRVPARAAVAVGAVALFVCAAGLLIVRAQSHSITEPDVPAVEPA